MSVFEKLFFNGLAVYLTPGYFKPKTLYTVRLRINVISYLTRRSGHAISESSLQEFKI